MSGSRLTIWNIYQSAWGPLQEPERRRLLCESVAKDIIYRDPASQTHGLDELVARIAESQKTFSGAYFKNDDILEHHDVALFRWTMYDAEGAVFVKGSSFARFGQNGLVKEANGFFKAPTSK